MEAHPLLTADAVQQAAAAAGPVALPQDFHPACEVLRDSTRQHYRWVDASPVWFMCYIV